MALIGQGTNAALGATDYSGAAQSAWNLANSNSNAIGHLAGALGDASKQYFEDQKKKKDAVKVGADQIDAAITLFGDPSGYLSQIKNKINDQERPLSERAGLGASVQGLIDMGTKKLQQDREFNLDNRRVTASEQANNQNIAEGQFKLGQAQQEATGNQQYASVAGPALLNSLLDQTNSYEQSGKKPLISSEQLSAAINLKPEQQMKLAELAMSGLPKTTPKEFRDIPITIDGQPGSATAVYDDKSGTFNVVPVGGSSGGLSGLPKDLAPYAQDFIDAGKETGLDPKLLAAISMHETANGTSSAFRNKNNAMGISDNSGPTQQNSVRDSIFRQARTLANPNGPYRGVQTLADLAKVYAPVGAGNDPRGLNGGWSQGVQANLQRLSSGNGITAGAVKSEGRQPSPLEIQKQQLEIAKMGQDIQNQQQDRADKVEAKDQAKWNKIDSANRTIQLVDQIVKSPGFSPTYGTSLNIGGHSPIAYAGSDKANTKAMVDQFKGQVFLDAVQGMRGMGSLSDAEGKKLEAAASRLGNTDISEKEAMQAAEEIKSILRDSIRKSGGQAWGDQPNAEAETPELRALRLKQLQLR